MPTRPSQPALSGLTEKQSRHAVLSMSRCVAMLISLVMIAMAPDFGPLMLAGAVPGIVSGFGSLASAIHALASNVNQIA